jgi:hypothetical protein
MRQTLLFSRNAKAGGFFRWIRDVNCRSYRKKRSLENTLLAQERILQLLKGTSGAEPCWTDKKLRDYIVEKVDEIFCLNDFWRTQILIAFYLDKELTIDVVDQQISDVRDFQDYSCASNLYGFGKGWNPIRISRCIEKATGFSYAYVPLYHPIWQSRFRPGSKTSDEVFEQQTRSPLVSYGGTRGCVTKLTFTAVSSADAEEECLLRFLDLYKKIVPDFFAGSSDRDLRSAIDARNDFTGTVGDVAVRFSWQLPQTDGGELAKRVAQLVLGHPTAQ